MEKITFTDRLRYAFDNAMSRGTANLIGWLAIITLVLTIIFALLASIFNLVPTDQGIMRTAWMCLMRTIDSGTVAGDEGSWGFLGLMLVVTFSGIFVFSTLIGILAAGLEAKLDDLRKGRSRVIENGHTVILGWSPQIFTIISELVIANANLPNSCIVILGNRDKVDMEDEIRTKVGPTGRTRIVCRTGKPIEMTDLEIVSLNTARSIIILSPETDDPDSWVFKTMLAITNHPERREEPYHIVAEIHKPRNIGVAGMVGRDEAQLLLSGDVVSRIMAQTCLQSGLSVVYMEILNFKGDEIYFHAEPRLVGKTFGDSILAYEDSSVLGMQMPDGTTVVNPAMDTLFGEGSKVIALSSDDDTIRLSGLTELNIERDRIAAPVEIVDKPENILILGWNWRTRTVIDELHKYFSPGSTVTVVADVDDSTAGKIQASPTIHRDTVTFKQGDTTDREVLEDLNILDFEYVIIMCYSDHLETQSADARTLITLLHLREIEDAHGHNFSIVSEMLDISNRELAEVTRADDFVVSDSLISLMLTQLSENKDLGRVYDTLFDIRGSEIYLEPMSNYVKIGDPINFYTVVESARQRGEIAIGYRVGYQVRDASKAYGVVVNPHKSSMYTFKPNDSVIVLKA